MTYELPTHQAQRTPTLWTLVACALVLPLSGCASLRSENGPQRNFQVYRERFNEGFHLVLAGRHTEALEPLRALAADANSRNEFRDDALFWLAYCYQELAADAAALRTREGRGEKPTAQELAWKEEAVRTYLRLIAEHPDSRYAAPARDRISIIGIRPTNTQPAPAGL